MALDGPNTIRNLLEAENNWSWMQAWGDASKARYASNAIMQWFSDTCFDARRNLADFAQQVVTPPYTGTVVPDTTIFLSGTQSLKMMPDDAGSLGVKISTRKFLVHGDGVPYRIRVVYRKATSTAGNIAISVDSHQYSQVGAGFAPYTSAATNRTPKAAGLWATAYYEVTFSGPWASVGVYFSGTTEPLYIDAIYVECMENAIPVGTISQFYGNLLSVAGVDVGPTLPLGWELLDGHVCTDLHSPLYNQTLADFNTTAAFVRGGNTSSTVLQADATAVNGLSAQVTAHQHTMVGSTASWVHRHFISTSGTTSAGTPASSAIAHSPRIDTTDSTADTGNVDTGHAAWSGNTGNNTLNPFCSMLGDAETRPKNLTMQFMVKTR